MDYRIYTTGGRRAGRTRERFARIAPDGVPHLMDLVYWYRDAAGEICGVRWSTTGEVSTIPPEENR